jgi:mRNA-degrading endonuclease RelE of RelBE toxin-antitoxin system
LDYKIDVPNRVKRYIKKIKDKHLKKSIVEAIYEDIPHNPNKGISKIGDLVGIYTWAVNYQGTTYRIAYTFENESLILIVLVGPHENFYQALKRTVGH